MNAMSKVSLSIRMKLLGTAAVLLVFMTAVGVLSYVNLGSVDSTASQMNSKTVVPLGEMGLVYGKLNEVRAYINKDILETSAANRTTIEQNIADDEKIIDDNLALVQPTLLTDTGKQSFADIESGLTEFKKVQAQVLALADQNKATDAYAMVGTTLLPAFTKVETPVLALFDQKQSLAETQYASVQSSVSSGQMLILILLGIAIGVGLLLALFLARNITGGVKSVQATLTSMADNCATYLENGLAAFARNDLTVEVHAVTHPIEKFGTDEIGVTAKVTNKMLGQLQATIESYETARAGLTSTVGEVKLAADSVARTSSERQRRRDAVGQRVVADRPDDQPGRLGRHPSRPRPAPTRAMPSSNSTRHHQPGRSRRVEHHVQGRSRLARLDRHGRGNQERLGGVRPKSAPWPPMRPKPPTTARRPFARPSARWSASS